MGINVELKDNLGEVLGYVGDPLGHIYSDSGPRSGLTHPSSRIWRHSMRLGARQQLCNLRSHRVGGDHRERVVAGTPHAAASHEADNISLFVKRQGRIQRPLGGPIDSFHLNRVHAGVR